VSGNPNGRPPVDPARRQLERVTREQAGIVLQQLVGPALRVLENAMRSDDYALAIRAAVDVLDRTQGRATQTIAATVTSVESATLVSVEQLQAAARKLLASQAVDVQEVERADPD
jgi:hypothetical protein